MWTKIILLPTFSFEFTFLQWTCTCKSKAINNLNAVHPDTLTSLMERPGVQLMVGKYHHSFPSTTCFSNRTSDWSSFLSVDLISLLLSASKKKKWIQEFKKLFFFPNSTCAFWYSNDTLSINAGTCNIIRYCERLIIKTE